MEKYAFLFENKFPVYTFLCEDDFLLNPYVISLFWLVLVLKRRLMLFLSLLSYILCIFFLLLLLKFSLYQQFLAIRKQYTLECIPCHVLSPSSNLSEVSPELTGLTLTVCVLSWIPVLYSGRSSFIYFEIYCFIYFKF